MKGIVNMPAPAAASPWTMSRAEWIAVLKRSWSEASDDNIGLVAAGVAFYAFLAIVPLLAATVLSYGLLAEPATVVANVRTLTQAMPADAAALVGEQLMAVVQTSEGKKGLGLLVALGVALFGARNGAGAVVTALNIAYEEKEKRGFVRMTLVNLAITVAAVVAAITAGLAVTALAALEEWLPRAPVVAVLGKIVSYLILLLVAAAGAATLYRYGPSRARARWTWITPGSLLAAIGWVALTLGFGIYVANFGNYNATYGSLGAVVVLLTWLYLSSYILLFGAELNSEFEHQTAQDTTTGAPVALGARGAWVADHVAGTPAAPPTRAEPAPRGFAGAGTALYGVSMLRRGHLLRGIVLVALGARALTRRSAEA
jgi:membrane protein